MADAHDLLRTYDLLKPHEGKKLESLEMRACVGEPDNPYCIDFFFEDGGVRTLIRDLNATKDGV